MSSLNQEFYLVRVIGSDSYESGTGAYAVPKLYQRGPANGLVSRRNKEALRREEHNRRNGHTKPEYVNFPRYEAVRVVVLTMQEAT